MCPDTVLLAASVDGTLFPPDARAVDQHVAACGRCAEILGRFRQERDVAHAHRLGAHSRTRGLRSAGLVALVAAAGCLTIYAVGAVNVGTADTATRQLPLLPSRVANLRLAMITVPVTAAVLPSAHADSWSRERSGLKAPKAVAPRRHVDAAGSAAEASAAGEVAETEPAATTGLVVRGKNGKPAWRSRDGVIEHSVDGGATWVDEYRPDRAIVAGAYVAPEVAWLAGADGVILRRTSVGWFEASARADGEVASIRASGPTRASITLVDGRTFDTNNAGVVWTEAPPSDQRVKPATVAPAAAPKRASASRRRPKRSRR